MDFKTLLETKKQNLATSTVKAYISGWNAIRKMFKIPADDLSVDFLKNVESVIDTIRTESNDNINTLKFKIAVVLEVLKLTDEVRVEGGSSPFYKTEIAKYKEYMDMLRAKVDKINEEHLKTPKQAEKWVSDDEKDIILEYLKHNLSAKKIITPEQLLNYRNYVLYVLQTELGTRNDLAYSIIMPRPTTEKKVGLLPTTENYILLNKKDKSIQYVMNVYKTAKTHGQIVTTIKNELYPVLDKYMKGLKIYVSDVEGVVGGVPLFLNEDCKTRMTANRLGVVFAGLGQLAGLDKKLSTTVLRHQKASANFEAMKKIAADAKTMAHSIATHANYMVE